jgi:hypothetical protein
MVIIIKAQETGTKYFFKEIGWTITLPAEFKILDSSENAKKVERGVKMVEESNGITTGITKMKTLITATKDKYNYFNSTMTPFDSTGDESYDATTQIVKDMLYKTYFDKMAGAKIDSITTIDTIDGLSFDKFHVTITLKQNLILNTFMLSKYYKGYVFFISYLYLDEQTRELIESMLKNSTFNK